MMLRMKSKILQLLSTQSHYRLRGSHDFQRQFSGSTRQFQYFDNLEVKDGVAIVRLNGPGKVNTVFYLSF